MVSATKPNVYTQCRLNLQELNEITRIKESHVCTCGWILFSPGSKYEKSIIIVREALTCNTTIETQYYSAKLVSFPPICHHCGIGEECIVNDEEIQELKKICCCVYPILCAKWQKNLFVSSFPTFVLCFVVIIHVHFMAQDFLFHWQCISLLKIFTYGIVNKLN